MASSIERVEREFVILGAAEVGTVARVQAQGRTVALTMSGADRNQVRFASKDGASAVFKPWEKVSVYFDFRGQGFVFETSVRKAARDSLELDYPETMYRGLSRLWPRVKPPRDLSLDLLLPDGDLELSCPVSREYVDVDLPESRGGLRADSLPSLIQSFRAKASELCDESRVVMFKEGKGPADFGEELASNWGRALFIPSFLSGLPLVDPYPEGRVITKSAFEEADGEAAFMARSRFGPFLEEKSREGYCAAIWCPVRYYRWTIGVAWLANRQSSQRAFDFRMLDFAWDFSRLLAWFLRSYGYYDGGRMGGAPRRGAIVDASPTGILVGLGAGQPRFRPGSRLSIALTIGDEKRECVGRIARHFEEDGRSYYGLAMEGLDPGTTELLSKDLYGTEAVMLSGKGG